MESGVQNLCCETPRSLPTTTPVIPLEQPANELGLPPLCVDLDGTLIRTDTLWEMVIALMKERPWKGLLLPLWLLLHGRAGLKKRLAEAVRLDWAALPYTTELVAYLREAHAAGRKLV